MITLTKDAEQAIRHLLVVSGDEKAAGVRLSSGSGAEPIDIDLITRARRDDTKLDGVAVPVFLAHGLAEEWDGHALHADVDEKQGTVVFSLVDLESEATELTNSP